jgi:hypothetical protein
MKSDLADFIKQRVNIQILTESNKVKNRFFRHSYETFRRFFKY